MKQLFIALMLLCFGVAPAQIQKLGALSSGNYVDSAVIMQDDESDVFGYCLLYESDRKSRDVFSLQYVILDKNLNKLTSFNITQAIYQLTLFDTRAEITFVKKIGNQLTIGINDRVSKMSEYKALTYFNYRFINVNLDDFTVSKEFKYENYSKKEFEYETGDKVKSKDILSMQILQKTKSDYFLSFGKIEWDPALKGMPLQNYFKQQRSIKRFVILDKEMNIVWGKDINTDKKTACIYQYLDSDTDVLLLVKKDLKNDAIYTKSVEAYDIHTGKLLGEILMEDEKYAIDLFKTKIGTNGIDIFVDVYHKKNGKNLGEAQLHFDKSSLVETKRKFIFWKDLATVIPGITENGKINKEFLVTQDFIITPKGALLMVLETATSENKIDLTSEYQKLRLNLGDMYLIEFNPDMSITFSKKLEKSNSVDAGYSGPTYNELRASGVYDYIFDQKLNKSGDFVFFYKINDQSGSKRKIAKKPLYTLGIVSNVNGEYGFETLPLYGAGSKIYPSLAKNGYIKLLEINEAGTDAELRLEKINY